MFGLDICLCASEECPRYEKCLRGRGIKRKGIYTMSYLASVCNENNAYESYISLDDYSDEDDLK